ncbi:ankyrin repeat containing protein [Neofusicoccum parvum]|uniref:Ankyrin repeat containing protein n=1 Tax=Neofusicoccum parvum TaxID=310453 RepID=A0ACB5RPF0_9PEZI|nr:ankyrin repeat containing protein [Neofusicoccum parvum]
MLEALLECGADYTIHTDDSYNILHMAASKADVRTLRILAAHGLPGIDLDLRYKDTGETALELFEDLKWDKSAGQIRAFYRMWRQVSLRARLKHGSIPDLRVIEELGSDSDLSEDESDFRADEDGEEILEEDEDEDDDDDDDEDVFVDAPEC